MVAVVSEYEVTILGDFIWAEGSSWCFREEAVIQWDFGVVDVDFAVCDLDFFSGEADDSFDEELAFVVGIFEDDDVEAFRVFCFL